MTTAFIGYTHVSRHENTAEVVSFLAWTGDEIAFQKAANLEWERQCDLRRTYSLDYNRPAGDIVSRGLAFFKAAVIGAVQRGRGRRKTHQMNIKGETTVH